MKHKKTAFTLIELLVVIVIIGILATITTATFGSSIEKGYLAKSASEYYDFDLEIKADCIVNNQDCGENLVLNPHFGEGDTNWPLPSFHEAINGELRKTGTFITSYEYIVVPVSLVNGKRYRVDMDVLNYSGSSDIGFSSSGGTPSGVNRRGSNGRITFVFSYTSGNIRLYTRNSNSATFDNVSIRELK